MQVDKRQFIYHVAAGSHLHGIVVNDQRDKDELAVFMPTARQLVGFHTVDTVVHRPGRGPQDKSGPGDLDLTIYSLGKYLRLFLKGNPSIVQTAWVPPELIYELTPAALEMLHVLRVNGMSQRFLKSCHGYMQSQIAGLNGSRGTKVKRPELVSRYGYDVKYAFHAMRLGLQGIEFALHGELVLPLTSQRHPMKAWVRVLAAVRRGEVPYDEMMERLNEVVFSLEDVTHTPSVPAEPNEVAVEDWYMDALRTGLWAE